MTSIDIPINRITYVSSIDGCCEVVVEAKAMDAFTEAIEIVVFGQSIDKLDELILVYQMRALGGEDCISGRSASDREPKRWIVTPSEREVKVVV